MAGNGKEESRRARAGTHLTRGERIALGAVLVLALALRIAYLLQVRDHPLFTVLTGDPAIYYAQARDILAGTMVPDHAYFHSSPVYPFVLALIQKLGGSGLGAVRLVQSFVGTISVWLVFLLGRHTVGKRAGLVASLLAALYVPFIFFEAEVLEITLVVAFVLGALVQLVLAAERGSVWRALLAGALVGLAGLGKPNILLFAPVAALWLYRAWGDAGSSEGRNERSGAGRRDRRGGGRTDGAGTGRRGAARTRAVPAVLFFLAAGAVVLPATIHNYKAEGDFIPVSSNGGINFFIGNHLNSPGVFQVPPEMRFDLRVASREAAQRAVGRDLSAGEVSDYWTRETFRQIGHAPARWLALMARKFVLFWNHYEIPNHYDLYFVRESASVLRLPVGTFGVVAPLGVFGIALALMRKKRVGLLVTFGLTFMASVVPFFITGRYRLAVVPVLLVGAGYAIDALWRGFRGREWRGLAAALLCVAVLAVAVNVRTIEFGFAQMHNSVGAILGGRGDMAGAAVEFEKALAENPRDLSARYNLGLALLDLERYEEAGEHFERALEYHPGYYEAAIGLAGARAGEGRTEEALEILRMVAVMNPPPEIAEEAERLRAALEPTRDETERSR